MKTRVLDAAAMTTLLDVVGRDRFMDLMIERLRSRFREHDEATVQVRTRDGFRYDKPALGLLEWMPTHEVELAEIQGVGAEVQLEHLPADPYDPYGVALSAES